MSVIKKTLRSLYKAGYWTIHHDGIEHAGYLAFLGLLSFFPFLVFFVALVGFLGQAQIGAEFYNNLASFLPAYIMDAIQPRIEEIISGPPQSLMTLAIIGAIWTASSAVEGIRTILNRAYRVHAPPAYIWRRLLSIAQFLVITMLIISTMFTLVFGPIIWAKIKSFLAIDADIIKSQWHYIQYGLSSLVLFATIASIYYTLPNVKQSRRYVLPGAFIALLGWAGSAYAFSLYLQNFQQVNLIYGSLGGIIVSLLFLYIIGIIFIFGAEFNYFFEKSLGHAIKKKEQS